MEISKGSIRKLEPLERQFYGDYKYVTLTEFVYTKGSLEIEVPRGFLTNGSCCAWIFYDYLYSSHEIRSRAQVDSIVREILSNERLSFTQKRILGLFIHLAKINFLWLFSRAWTLKGRVGPQMMGYELKKDI